MHKFKHIKVLLSFCLFFMIFITHRDVVEASLGRCDGCICSEGGTTSGYVGTTHSYAWPNSCEEGEGNVCDLDCTGHSWMSDGDKNSCDTTNHVHVYGEQIHCTICNFVHYPNNQPHELRTVYTDWTDWSAWSTTSTDLSTSNRITDGKKVVTQTRTKTRTKTDYWYCPYCGNTYGNVDTTETETQTRQITYYKLKVTIYKQNTDGTWSESSSKDEYVEYSTKENASTPNGFNSESTTYKNNSYTWSYEATNVHYPSNTHTSANKSDANINVNMDKAREFTRYIYRKQYYVTLYSNPQTDASTTISKIDIGSYKYKNDTSQSKFETYNINDYRLKYYAGASITIPTTHDTFRMIGYTSNGWYTGATNGTNKGTSIKWEDGNKSYNSPNTLYSYNLYAHWCSEPGRLYLMPNSQNIGTDSCYAAYIGGNKNTYLFSDKTSSAEYSTNTKKLAFDTSVSLPDVNITNVTVNFTTPDSTADFATRTTNVKFAGWTTYKDYNNNYYNQYLNTNTVNNLISLIDCKQCNNLSFHGTLSNTLNKTYTYNNGNWANNANENKGSNRNSLAVANFSGSWNILLPNAYRDGYIFTGWYNGDTYMGIGGETIDISDWVRTYNTTGSVGLVDIKADSNKNLSVINLTPHFEPINYKVLYIMNIPSDSDTTTTVANDISLQSHSLLPDAENLTDIHSLSSDGSDGKGSHTVGSTDTNNKDYSYIGSKTYTYDGSDWTLENMPITVNDYLFTGWTYEDILWTGYGGMQANNITLGSTVIGGGIADTYDVASDYALKTLSMEPNVVKNVRNNLPDTVSYSGQYTNTYTVSDSHAYLNAPCSDGTNALAGNRVSGLNNSKPTVYIVLKANWTSDISADFNTDLKYDSNNDSNSIYTVNKAYKKLTEYINLFKITDKKLSNKGFGSVYNANVVSSTNTSVGDTSDDGSYDKNASTDTFVVNANSDKYYNGASNGRTGFFSFQGWSTWKYATWRDAIDSNKKDTDNSELQVACGVDNNSISKTFNANALTLRKYNDVSRSKRVGDLYYRMAGILYPNMSYNESYINNNISGNMLSSDGTGDKYTTELSKTLWNAYKWRWTKGTTGHYTIPIKNVLDSGIIMYAIWDSYPTSQIMNTYCYIDDIETLTPGYLFSKVIATDFEDFWNQKNYAIGETSDNNVDWNTVAVASSNMNNESALSCPAGDYTYTYSLSSDANAYMGGKFTATLCGYDFNRFKNATFVDDIASVSVTYKFVDSAGNTTYKTAWVYIIDKDDTDYEPNPDEPDDIEEPDNVRYSMTRFISDDFYNKAEFDEDGDYIINSAKEDEGSLLLRSKWYMVDGYKNELLQAFDNLEEIGSSSLNINAFGDKIFSPSVTWSGIYHPQLNSDTGEWKYDFNAIGNKTKGIYVLDYDAILATKEFVKNNGYDTGNFSGNKVQEYIKSIFGDTAVKAISD